MMFLKWTVEDLRFSSFSFLFTQIFHRLVVSGIQRGYSFAKRWLVYFINEEEAWNQIKQIGGKFYFANAKTNMYQEPRSPSPDRSKNSPTCENAVARTHGIWMLRLSEVHDKLLIDFCDRLFLRFRKIDTFWDSYILVTIFGAVLKSSWPNGVAIHRLYTGPKISIAFKFTSQ